MPVRSSSEKYARALIAGIVAATFGCSASSQDLGNNDPRGGDSGGDGSGAMAAQGDNGSDSGVVIRHPGDAAPEASSGPKRIFVTSTKYAANFGEPTKADQLCTASAQAAGLGGQWAAWVGDQFFPVLGRITGNGPWSLVDGTEIFRNMGNLSTSPLAPIDKDELGGVVGPYEGAWTGTKAGGIPSGLDCSDWTVTDSGQPTIGTPANTDLTQPFWTDGPVADTFTCSSTNRFICLEQ